MGEETGLWVEALSAGRRNLINSCDSGPSSLTVIAQGVHAIDEF